MVQSSMSRSASDGMDEFTIWMDSDGRVLRKILVIESSIIPLVEWLLTDRYSLWYNRGKIEERRAHA